MRSTRNQIPLDPPLPRGEARGFTRSGTGPSGVPPFEKGGPGGIFGAGFRGWLALGALTAAGLALRLLHLTRFELFVDEAATWWFARLTATGRLAEQMSLEPTPPLYYALVGLLIRLFGDSDLVLRLPSAIFGAAAIPAVYVFGRSLFAPRVGWIAAVLLTFHPLHVFYSREARVYPLLLCLALAMWWALWRALERDTVRDWALFAGALVLVCYSHFYGLFLGCAAGLAVVLWGRGGARWRGLAASALAFAAFAPYLVLTLPHLRESGAAWSIESFYRDHPEEQRLGRVIEGQLIGADYHPYLRQLDRPPTPPLLRLACLLAQLGLLVAAMAVAVRRERMRELGFLTVAWLVPVLVPWAITLFGRAIFHAGRHDAFAVGCVCVLLAAGLDGLAPRRGAGGERRWRRPRRWAAVAAVVALAWGAGFRLAALHFQPASRHHRAAGEHVARHAGPGDRVIATSIRRLVTQHYTRLAGNPVPFESFPISTDDHPGWSDVMTLMEDQESLHAEARERIAALGREMPVGGTLFLLLGTYERTADAVSASWLVDRHVLENLWAAGWRRRPELETTELQIAAYSPPPSSARERSEEPRADEPTTPPQDR